MPTRSSQPRSWFAVLVGTLLTLFGCHMVLGDFEEATSANNVSVVCDKGAVRCNDEYLLSCNANQSAWLRKDTCASKEQCDSKSGSCLVCP